MGIDDMIIGAVVFDGGDVLTEVGPCRYGDFADAPDGETVCDADTSYEIADRIAGALDSGDGWVNADGAFPYAIVFRLFDDPYGAQLFIDENLPED